MNHLIKTDLLTDESILWSGQPSNQGIFTKGDFFLIPFSLMWAGFALFWETMAIRSGAPLLFKLWGLPFIVMGLYMVFGRFFYKSYLNKNTYYFVTTKRILILKNTTRRRTEAEYITAIPTINIDVNSEGKGNVIFGNTFGLSGVYANTGMELFVRNNHYYANPPSFYNIENANEVYQIVSEVRNNTYMD